MYETIIDIGRAIICLVLGYAALRIMAKAVSISWFETRKEFSVKDSDDDNKS